MIASRLPAWYIPHGGGPCFFMDPPPSAPVAWKAMEAFLRGIPASLGARPRAILVVSAHWLESRPTVTASAAPPLIYDYRGFPPHTYQLKYPAPGDPALAAGVVTRLTQAGIDSGADASRGLDHGVFIPLMLLYPQADIPVVQLSMIRSFDPAAHIALGRALAPLRDEGVLIVGSGMSYHNLQNMFRADARALAIAEKFDAWLTEAATAEPAVRDAALEGWADAPGARISHPHEDHLLPLMVAAGAALDDRGVRDYRDQVFSAPVSGYRFG
jgi:aromatic ring-opening dioxygenase catalytic subunit (LigB family)